MLCPKCNSNIPDKSTYCVRCGSTFNEKGEIISDPDEEKVSFDELLKLYVGEKYDKFEDNLFSIWQFLFGPFYSFYRKHYSYGFLSIFIYLSCNFLFTKMLNTVDMSYYAELINNKDVLSTLPKILEVLLIIAISYMLSKSYNKTYLKYSSTKVKNIMFSKKNYNADMQKKKCVKKGGTSILSIIIGFIIAYIILFSISFLLQMIPVFKEQIKQNQLNDIGNNICKKIEQNISNNQINIKEYQKINTINELKDYSGLFCLNDKKQIVLYAARYNNISCSGICGENMKCYKLELNDIEVK